MQSTVIVAWLAAELMKLPGSHAPGETREEYASRVHDVAVSLVDEAIPIARAAHGWSVTEIAVAGAIVWHGETLFDKRVQAGEAHPKWTQDDGRARCGMQLHSSAIVPQEVWEKLAGVAPDATHLCARYGLRVLVAQGRQCSTFIGLRADRARVAKTFASYATGGKCVPTDRDWQRADRWVKIMATRPDNERRAHPGFRRAGGAEVPPDILASARGIAAEIGKEPEIVPGFTRTESGHDGRTFMSVVEKHADGKIGVSVLVKE